VVADEVLVCERDLRRKTDAERRVAALLAGPLLASVVTRRRRRFRGCGEEVASGLRGVR
jgi:hypothetical protein